MLPALPDWGGMHVLVVHFPVAFLVSTPLLLIMALLWPRYRLSLAIAALLFLAAGTLGIIFASSTGDAAAEVVQRTPEISVVIDGHEELAENTRTVFIILTIFLAAVLILPRWIAALGKRGTQTTLLLLAVVATLGGDVLLARAAHEGGLLVHVYGVHARLSPDSSAPPPVPDVAGASAHDAD